MYEIIKAFKRVKIKDLRRLYAFYYQYNDQL